jgi:CMP/dCMP kinase
MPPHSVDELVQSAVLRWEAARRSAEEGDDLGFRPMIAISRDYAGGGTDVAEEVAKRLSFHVYDRDLVEKIAETGHARAALVRSLDERLVDSMSNWINSQFRVGALSHSEYLRTLCEVLLGLSRHGRGVIIGRGAQFILDPAYTLRVRAFAPLEVRIERVMQREKVERVAAQARIRDIDAERRAFTFRHFGKELAAHEHYDLVLNTGTLPIPVCADLVVSTFRARFPH